MEKTVMIGEKAVKLRVSAYLPILYRRIFREDLMRDMAGMYRESKDSAGKFTSGRETGGSDEGRAKSETADGKAEIDAGTENVADTTIDAETAKTDEFNVEKLVESVESVDIEFMAKLEYAMARHADSSVPMELEDWLCGLDDPNAIYALMTPALELYAQESATTAKSKKKSKTLKGK